MRSGIVIILVLLLLIITACSKSQEVICNKPYLLVGKDCCLDQNNNNVCDKDETSAKPQTSSPAAPSSTIEPTAVGSQAASNDISSSDAGSPESEPQISSSWDDNNAPAQTNSVSSNSNCGQVVYPENPGTGGMACHIRLVSPAPCQEVQFPVQFEWTTDGTYCETPYTLYVTGDPPLQSIFTWSLSENAEQGITKAGGGFVTVGQDDLANVGVTSQSGVYHWVVQGYHGSNPNSQGFVAR